VPRNQQRTFAEAFHRKQLLLKKRRWGEKTKKQQGKDEKNENNEKHEEREY
jgi:hypothetical protein